MKKIVYMVCAFLTAGVIHAGTIQGNLGFPDMNIIASQTDNDGANSVWRTDDTVGGAVGGQSFKLEEETTLRSITFQKQGTKTFTGAPSEIWLFIGGYTNSVDTNGLETASMVIASTNLMETFDVSGQTLTNELYYSLNFDADLTLDAGTYAYQLWFAQTNASHVLTMKRGGASSYTNGVFFWNGSTTEFPNPTFTDSSAIGGDYTFGLHREVVGVVPTVVTLSSDEIAMNFTVDLEGATGKTSIGYDTVSGSNVVVTSIVIGDETHTNAFTNLTVLPLVMSNALPATTALDFQFDNTIAGLTATEMATATATIDWNEEGGTNGQFIVSLSALALEALPSSTITNTGSAFPTDDDIILAQDMYNSADGVLLVNATTGSGQTFTLDANKAISGFTFLVRTGSTLDDGDHSLKVWVGEMDGTTAGATVHESSIDVSGHSLASGTHQRIDFAEDLNLSAGTYGVQLAWGVGAVTLRLGTSQTNVYDGGQSQRFTYAGTLPVNGGGRSSDLVFALHGTAGPEGYEGWLLQYDLGEDDAMTDNPDGDAYNNLYEYAFGGNPTNGADIGYKTPVEFSLLQDGGTNWVEYVYARRIAASNELNYSLEFAGDLVEPSWGAGAYVELPDTGIFSEDDDFETVTNRVDTTGKTVEFIQVKIVEQP